MHSADNPLFKEYNQAMDALEQAQSKLRMAQANCRDAERRFDAASEKMWDWWVGRRERRAAGPPGSTA